MNVKDFLLEYAPDFCWCSSQDLLIMAEQIDEDVNPGTVFAWICQLHKGGYLISKRGERKPGSPFLYLNKKQKRFSK